MDRFTTRDWLALGGMLASIIVYGYTNFATKGEVHEAISTLKQYVDQKQVETKDYSDKNRAAMEKLIERQTVTLEQIKEVTQRLESRTWDERHTRR